jgi:hypothetical protein
MTRNNKKYILFSLNIDMQCSFFLKKKLFAYYTPNYILKVIEKFTIKKSNNI